MVKPLRKNASKSDDLKAIDDDRFSNLVSAPIFKKTSKSKNKVVLDDRFKQVLTDERFRVLPGNSVDSYGRKKKKVVGEDAALQELKSFYDVATEDNEEDGEVNNQAETKSKAKSSKEPKEDEFTDRLDYLTKLARGEISGSDESSDEESGQYEVDDDASDDSEDYDENDDQEGLLNKKSPLDIPEEEEEIEFGEATKRVSILNCDWENIKAQDLM